jgi:predicted regulator of Ras-like GTPase activity (Roadblock/LC7/MglB family)
MFKDLLQEVVENTHGAVAGLLMGFDGIMVDSYAGEDIGLNVETIGMEYSAVLNQIKQAAEMLDIGKAREVAVQAETLTTVIRLLNDEYFVALAMLPSGNIGKARYLLRTNAEKILETLI